MDQGDSTPELEEISEAECLQLLGRHSLGRVGVVVDGQPLIFPVNYALQNRIIVFRTAPGTKLSYAPMSKVAFEIDDYDASTGVGWSVMVQGVAQDATAALDDISWTARGATPHPLPPGVRAHRIAINSQTITGRRFHVSVEEFWTPRA